MFLPLHDASLVVERIGHAVCVGLEPIRIVVCQGYIEQIAHVTKVREARELDVGTARVGIASCYAV